MNPGSTPTAIMPAPVLDGTRYRVALDSSGSWPTLCLIDDSRGAHVALNGRRNPILDAERVLATVLRGHHPRVVVLIGLGLGYTLDALERQNSQVRVLAFEPLPEAIPHFLARRDWSRWLDTGRLTIVTGPDYENALEAWTAAAPEQVPSVIVSPALAQACPDLVAAARGAVVRAQFGSAFDSRLTVARQSMLHAQVLAMLEHSAATATGAIVEIGAYVGGATIAMTRGIRDCGRDTLMFTVEPGGAYPTHPDLPSHDIFGDLQENLRTRGLGPYVNLLQGHSSEPWVLETIRIALRERGVQVGMLCIDADGEVQRDFDLYLPMCAPGCRIVVDDYSGPPQNTKTDPTQAAVDALVASGRARKLGVFGWGTWFGVYTP
jgi:predicted O-methyltransferase YrrM